jgi:hypothetical protein
VPTCMNGRNDLRPSATYRKKLLEAAQRCWRRLDATSFLPKVIYGVKFKNGIEEQDASSHPQAKTVAA